MWKVTRSMTRVTLMILTSHYFTQTVAGTGNRNSSANQRAHNHQNLGYKISDEKRLVKVLLRSYRRIGKVGRPVVNVSDPVTVLFGLGLIQLDVDEKNNMLALSTWVRYHWKDEYLQWNPGQFGGVDRLKLPHNKIWTPDIMLYNTANTEEYIRSALLIVSHTGMVQWYPHRLYQSACAFDVRNYPFDNQTCHLAFGSWTHTLQELDLRLAFENGLDLSTFQADYKDSSKWEITGIEGRKQMVDETYGVLSFRIELRRKLMFSSYILTIPAVFLAFLTLIVFVLPADDVEKSILGLTIFGSLLILLLILVEAAPSTASAVPLLGLFYCFTTVIVILSVFLASLVVKLGNADNQGKRRRVPGAVKKVMFRGIARCLFIDPLYIETNSDGEASNKSKRQSRKCESVFLADRMSALPNAEGYLTRDSDPDLHRLFTCQDYKVTYNDGVSNDSTLTVSQYTLIQTLQTQLKSINFILEEIAKRQQATEDRNIWEKEVHSEWKYLASVLDRLFFIIYFVAIILSILLLFPWRAD